MFVKWILSVPKYKTLLNNLQITNRQIYIKINFPKKNITSCFPTNYTTLNSFIVLSYTKHILLLSNKNITKIDSYMKQNKNKLIEIDKIFLKTFEKIEIPIIDKSIFSIIIDKINNKQYRLNSIYSDIYKNIYKQIKLTKKTLEIFEMLYYNILELKLESIYINFVRNFKKSKQYKFLNNINVYQYERWCITCLSIEKLNIL